MYNQFQETGFILGWLEVRVRAPEPKELIDIRYNDGTIVFKRQADEDLLTKMRQKDALWRPAILEI